MRVSIKDISTLSMNPHFHAYLIQHFLSGYGRPCDIQLVFMALPIILFSESREKLIKANSRSTMETIFGAPQKILDSNISGRTRVAGYLERYSASKEYGKKAIIILYSEKKIVLDMHTIILSKNLDYRKCNGKIKEWARVAHYLGIVFSNTTMEQICSKLGVNKHE